MASKLKHNVLPQLVTTAVGPTQIIKHRGGGGGARHSPQIFVGMCTAKWEWGAPERARAWNCGAPKRALVSIAWNWRSPELTVGRVWLAPWPAAIPATQTLCVRAGCSKLAKGRDGRLELKDILTIMVSGTEKKENGDAPERIFLSFVEVICSGAKI